ncbi:MAG: aminoacyl-tRNA hydrolase [Burkholderiaceae bacterium]
MIKLFVGLGNPGTAYEATRHNAGFWWIDALARQQRLTLVADKSYQALVVRGQAGNPGNAYFWLLQPQTFMNLSGQSVGALARFYKIAPEEILVVHDELDLPPGEAKLKLGGSHAGHNGLRDIHAQIGPDYWRLRLGVGHPGDKSEVVGWVLQKPSLDDRIAITQAIDRSRTAWPELLHGAMDKAMLKIHTRQPPRPKPPKPAATVPPAAV